MTRLKTRYIEAEFILSIMPIRQATYWPRLLSGCKKVL